MSSAATVAVLGAGGSMGTGMTRNILRAGMPVRAWNRSREKTLALARDGALIVDSPADAAEGSAIVVTMLSDVDALLDVMEGEAGFLSALPVSATLAETPIWVQMSTIGVAGTERCAEVAQHRGLRFVDAPVLGSTEAARRGELIVMASGPRELERELEPLFAALGANTMWLGPAGVGSALQVVASSWIVTVVEATAEAITLAEGTGVDPREFLRALAGGPLDLPFMQVRAQATAERESEPALRLELAARDARLAAEMAEEHDLDLPLLAAVCARLAEGMPPHGGQDEPSTYLTSAPGAGPSNGSTRS